MNIQEMRMQLWQNAYLQGLALTVERHRFPLSKGQELDLKSEASTYADTCLEMFDQRFNKELTPFAYAVIGCDGAMCDCFTSPEEAELTRSDLEISDIYKSKPYAIIPVFK